MTRQKKGAPLETRADPLTSAPPDPEGVYDPSAGVDMGRDPVPPADGSVPVLEEAPRPIRERMARLWWTHFAPLYAAVGRGDLIPRRKRRWVAKRQGGERTLELVEDEVTEETPTLAQRQAFGDALLEMAVGRLGPQVADADGKKPELPAMPPLVWLVGDQAQQSAPPTEMTAGLIALGKKQGALNS